MKKTIIVLLALLMAVSVFAGCEVKNPLYDGSSAASTTAEPSSEPEPTEEPSDAPSEVSKVESSSNGSTANLLNALTGDSDEEKIAAYVDMFADIVEMSDDQMSLKLEARGTAIVYVCTAHFIDSDEDGSYAAYFESYTVEQESEYENLVEQLKSAGIGTPIIIIEYLDNNGDMIFTKEYK